jgi:hypothetical protein
MELIVFEHALVAGAIRPTVDARAISDPVVVDKDQASLVLLLIEVLLLRVTPFLICCIFIIAEVRVGREWHSLGGLQINRIIGI